jgi:sugar/nucleoside kinase (ribokinase family)
VAAIAVIGELNLDLIVTGAQGLPHPGEEKIVGGIHLALGASSAIIAAQLARLGDDILFISKVGGDHFGQRALEFLRATGVATDAIAVDPALPTGLTISIAVGGERAMLTDLGCIQELRYADIDPDLLRGRRHLHISSFYLQRHLRPDIGRIFSRARDLGLTTSLDTGWPTEEETDGDLEAVWPHLDLFLPNEAEAMRLTGRADLDQALAALAARVPTVAVKLGPRGAVARRGDEIVRRPAFAVEVVETTGAGDSFNGGFLHAWLSGAHLGDCLDLGNACGALSTRAPGGTTSQPDLQEALAFIRSAPRREPS